ncbi:MAG: glutathione S-transferase C-terminal domain-containing protein, partial [Alphaproteobacteria bacterium]|nr:glutathione S-transferase C-terminal domain-containing protein [Alphaproteobacteria bacterium]
EGHDAVRTAAIRRMGEALALIDTHVEGPFLLGAEMTVADIYLAMFLVWYRGGEPPPRLARIRDAVRGHPIVGPIWHRHYGDREGEGEEMP